jgi:ELWxxDGT repeat protein
MPESVVCGGNLFFTSDDGVHGNELWKTDGTTSGTVLVKDIYPGSNGSGPRYLVAMGSNLLFAAADGENGTELWISDGTADGTRLFRDIRPGPSQ